ncbi:MAG TPA: aminotransferase class I/II-fold pyridoxal phosphate-dependent enzyme [Planctomycetota bacterium]|nr:aminotransferase class I/II-fold pyridoxal phosphate-dependent enzyme [Planctomycetota bacterium]
MVANKSEQVLLPAVRTRDIRYAVRDVVVQAERLRALGRRMLYLNIGDPNPFGFEPPKPIINAVKAAMDRNDNGYAPSDGIPEALAAIAVEATRKGVSSSVYTWIGNGCSEVIDMALTALVDRGQNVLTPSPGYPLYTALLSKLEAENRPYALDESKGWQPDLKDIERQIDAQTRAIVVINPNNPTGSLARRDVLKGIVALAKAHNLLVIADEIYDRLILSDEDHVALGSLDPEASVLTLGGLSKNWLVPGFRIGWGVLSGEAGRLALYKGAVQQLGRARLSANHPEQYGIAPALLGDQSHLVKIRAELRARTALTMGILDGSRTIRCVPPEGAFYAFPQLTGVADDKLFCSQLMEETGVVVVPGSGFGQKEGTQHFRIVLLPERSVLEEALHAIVAYADRA